VVAADYGRGQRSAGDQVADGAPGSAVVAFGGKVRSLRGDRSVRDFAKELGVSHGYLSDVEHGKTKPGRLLVQRIEAICGTDGALLEVYRDSLDEWDARKQAMAERRREIARQERDRLESGQSRQLRPVRSGEADGTDQQQDRYAGRAALEVRAGDRSLAGERDTNRREAVKAGVSGLLALGAVRAKQLLHWAEISNVGPLTLADYGETVAWLSEHSTVLPISKLVEIAEPQAAAVAERLFDGHHTGEQRAHLEQLTGQFAYLQGRFAFSLGNYMAAQPHLLLARHFGKLHSNHLLLASVADIESTIAFYRGQYQKSLQLAQEARQWATPHTQARLLVDEAKAYGGLGPKFRKELRDTLDQAERLLPDVLMFEPGAASPFGSEMFLYHAGTACVRAGDERAAELAGNAIRGYEALEARSDPRASYANLAAARLDLAIALVQSKRPDPKEAARLAVQALSMPREFHKDQVKRRLNELLGLLLAVPAWRNLPMVKELVEMARTYRPLALPAPPPRPPLSPR